MSDRILNTLVIPESKLSMKIIDTNRLTMARMGDPVDLLSGLKKANQRKSIRANVMQFYCLNYFKSLISIWLFLLLIRRILN